ncbi:MAG: DUF116 domain-containing protein [Candidatus Micrarchaeota archaeon]
MAIDGAGASGGSGAGAGSESASASDADGKTIRMRIKEFIARSVSVGLNISISDVVTAATKKLGVLDEKWANYTTVEVVNGLNRDWIKKIPKNERFVFIPHCLRNPKACKAPIDEDGYHCKKCGACVIDNIVRECEKRGMRWFVVGGGAQVGNIIAKYKPKGVIGIACFPELKMAMEKYGEMKLPGQTVLLKKAGCVNTEVDMEEILEKFDL